jgi:YegS/Rv2252/BmrU family lipid kinase
LNNQTVLIYNRAAGKGEAGKVMHKVLGLLERQGLECELLLTEGTDHAVELACRASEGGGKLVIAAGGDGTINEVINGLMLAELNGNKRPTLGVIPVGRGNDFAYGVQIPNEINEAILVLAKGTRRTIDVGRVTGGDYPQGRYFGNGIGLGFDTVVGFEAAKIKWLNGTASYLAGLMRTIFLYSKAPVYEIILDDGESVQQAFLMISVMNGSRMGGAFHMAPDGNPYDGIFDLCLASEVPQMRILPLAAKFLNGTQKEHPAVKMLQAKKITIRAIKGSIPAHADGETICTAGQALTIDLFAGALEVVAKIK